MIENVAIDCAIVALGVSVAYNMFQGMKHNKHAASYDEARGQYEQFMNSNRKPNVAESPYWGLTSQESEPAGTDTFICGGCGLEFGQGHICSGERCPHYRDMNTHDMGVHFNEGQGGLIIQPDLQRDQINYDV